ncbi:ferrochelatase [Nocardioides convexus]|uniref:ferrochelatase n=1 Tax=Nocardioides convexus TaxID=2712224 RepID=UPI0031019EC1
MAEHGVDLPIYWGNRNWAPYLTDTVEQMARDGVRRAVCVLTSAYSSWSSLPAVPREPRRRPRRAARGPGAAAARQGAGLLQPPGLRRRERRRGARRARRACPRRSATTPGWCSSPTRSPPP